jgi:glutamate-1-semialdehyde 2,1-aminomutase
VNKQSELWFERASKVTPGGVNSPVRSFKHVGGHPLFFDRGEGAYLFDVDNNKYIDFCLSFGPHILGHTHPEVVGAIERQVKKGISYGACHPAEVELAEQILRGYAYLNQVRLVNSGTEAVMTAVRLARGFTHRDKILKFEGCYHGHVDGLLVKSGSAVAHLSEATSQGIPASVVSDTVVARFDQIETIREAIKIHGPNLAAVIFEAIPANYGLWVPPHAHLQEICALVKQCGALVIIDEVISGFRVGLAGASGYYDLRPDLVTLGKVIGGGMPLAAVVGTQAVMQSLAPIGEVFQAGTLSGNPLAAAAGRAVLNYLFEHKIEYTQFDKRCEQFIDELRHALKNVATVRGINSLFWISFGEEEPTRFPPTIDTRQASRYAEFFKSALAEGLYLAPSPYEVGFLSMAHSEDVLGSALEKIKRCSR